MTTLDLITGIFALAALVAAVRPRAQVILAGAVAIAAPAAFGVMDGADGLVFSLAGASIALVLTMPLSLFGHVSRPGVLVSVALGGMIGAVQYSIVFAIATLFLAIQRVLRVEMVAEPAFGGMPGPRGSGFLGIDEQSALVEIEAMKILHKDSAELERLAELEGLSLDSSGDSGTLVQTMPWEAKLALATLAVLMIGSSL